MKRNEKFPILLKKNMLCVLKYVTKVLVVFQIFKKTSTFLRVQK